MPAVIGGNDDIAARALAADVLCGILKLADEIRLADGDRIAEIGVQTRRIGVVGKGELVDDGICDVFRRTRKEHFVRVERRGLSAAREIHLACIVDKLAVIDGAEIGRSVLVGAVIILVRLLVVGFAVVADADKYAGIVDAVYITAAYLVAVTILGDRRKCRVEIAVHLGDEFVDGDAVGRRGERSVVALGDRAVIGVSAEVVGDTLVPALALLGIGFDALLEEEVVAVLVSARVCVRKLGCVVLEGVIAPARHPRSALIGAAHLLQKLAAVYEFIAVRISGIRRFICKLVRLRGREGNENVHDVAVPLCGCGEHEGIVRHAVERVRKGRFILERLLLIGKEFIVLLLDHRLFAFLRGVVQAILRLFFEEIAHLGDEDVLVGVLKFDGIVSEGLDIAHVLARRDEVVGEQVGDEIVIRLRTGGRCGAFDRLVCAAVGERVAARIDSVCGIVILIVRRVDAGGRGADGIGGSIALARADDALFLRIDGVVEEYARIVLRTCTLLVGEEILHGEKVVLGAVFCVRDGRIEVVDRIFFRPVGVAAIIQKVYHGILDIDGAVDERIGDHCKRIVIRPAVLLHGGIARGDEVCDHIQLGDLGIADHIGICGIFPALCKVFALRDIHLGNDLLIVLFNVRRNQVAPCKNRAAQRCCKRDRPDSLCLTHCSLRQKLSRV